MSPKCHQTVILMSPNQLFWCHPNVTKWWFWCHPRPDSDYDTGNLSFPMQDVSFKLKIWHHKFTYMPKYNFKISLHKLDSQSNVELLPAPQAATVKSGPHISQQATSCCHVPSIQQMAAAYHGWLVWQRHVLVKKTFSQCISILQNQASVS